jgi:hypothetical protein
MLAFLHTSPVHVSTFDRLVRAQDREVPLLHEVREELLRQAVADGGVSDATRDAVQAVVQSLVASGARVVVCTCSTIGEAAERTPGVDSAHVFRVDRPMAEHAVSLGRPILVVAATPTAMTTALALLREAASGEATPRPRELLCAAAWSKFEAGELAAYAQLIAAEVDAHAQPGEVVVLAQASMAPAAALVSLADIELLTSPETGVRAALAHYAAARHP